MSEDEEEAAEGEAEVAEAEVAPAGSKRKTRTPHSDVGNMEVDAEGFTKNNCFYLYGVSTQRDIYPGSLAN